jgi:hypothetical protein
MKIYHLATLTGTNVTISEMYILPENGGEKLLFLLKICTVFLTKIDLNFGYEENRHFCRKLVKIEIITMTASGLKLFYKKSEDD